MSSFTILNPPYTSRTRSLVKARNTSALSVVNNTLTQITGWVEDYDTNNNFVTNVFTAPRAAKYHVNCSIKWASSVWTAGDSYTLSIRKNGTAVLDKTFFLETATAVSNSIDISGDIDCAATDTIDVALTQVNVLTAAKALTATAANNFLSIEELDNATINT